MTQEELAERTGISVSGIRNLESGRTAAPRPATVRLLADAFGLGGADRDRFRAAVSLFRPPAAGATPPAAVPVPAQLPPDVAGFTGRVDELRTGRAAAGGRTSSRPRW